MTNPPCPERLFRFFPPIANALFNDRKLWTSTAISLNDPFEILPRYDKLIEDSVDHRLRVEFAFDSPLRIDFATYQRDMAPIRQTLIDEAKSVFPFQLQRSFSEHYGIISFCENMTLTMWGHYAASHTGFVVEFDSAHPMFAPTSFGSVTYSAIRPAADPRLYQEILLTKSPEWSSECEWRLVKPFTELLKAQRGDESCERAYLPLDLHAVKSVFIGCRATKQFRQEIVDCLNTSEAEHIEISFMRPHESEFSLVQVAPAAWKEPADDVIADYNAAWKQVWPCAGGSL